MHRDSGSAPARALGSGAGDEVHIVHEADGLLSAQWKNIALTVWTQTATPLMVAKLDSLSRTFVDAHPEGVSAIHIVAKDVPLPDGHVRDLLAQLSGKYGKSTASVCHVVEGTGFWASALHSFLTGLHWVSRNSFQLHICGTIGDAVRWLPKPHQKTGIAVTPRDLERVMLSVRERAK